jgi:hypothetical protein
LKGLTLTQSLLGRRLDDLLALRPPGAARAAATGQRSTAGQRRQADAPRASMPRFSS